MPFEVDAISTDGLNIDAIRSGFVMVSIGLSHLALLFLPSK